MKKLLLLTAAFVFSLIQTDLDAQVLNNKIRYEVQSVQYWSSADGDDIFSGQDEIVITVEPWSSHSGWSLEPACETWSCDAPCYSADNDNFISGAFQVDFSTYLDFWIVGYESDNSNPCTYQSGDDFLYQGYAQLDQSGVITSQSPNGEWGYTWGPNNSIWISQSSTYDVQIKSLWFYRWGNTSDDPLEFGTIYGNDYKSHENVNLAAPSNSVMGIGYYDEVGNSSPDVFYSFTLAESANVTISTDNSGTNYDTYLRLYDSNGTQIDYNDDVETGNTKSLITKTLCAGNYQVAVEGYNSNTGNFKLEISTSPTYTAFIDNSYIELANCLNSDGEIEIDITDGVPPYTVNWSNGDTGEYITGLAEGVYTASITDACGNTSTGDVFVANEDLEAPVMYCRDLTVYIEETETSTIDPINIDDGSYDECGIDFFTLSQNQFTAANEGLNTVELTATDILGYSASCESTVTINVIATTAVEDIEGLSSWSVYPNPTTGFFNINLESDQLSNNARLVLTDAYGRKLWEQAAQNGTQTMDINHLNSGVYFVQLQDEGALKTERIVLQK